MRRQQQTPGSSNSSSAAQQGGHIVSIADTRPTVQQQPPSSGGAAPARENWQTPLCSAVQDGPPTESFPYCPPATHAEAACAAPPSLLYEQDEIPSSDYQKIAMPDADGDLAIHIAVAKEIYQDVAFIAQLMISNGLSLDKYNTLRQTPLHISVITCNVPIMRLLLESGASPSVCDHQGNTAVHLAAKRANRECMEVLLDFAGGEEMLNSLNYDGFAPLHLAVLRRDRELVKALACRNADVDVADGTSGRTPLFQAIESGFEDLVELFLGLGANVNRANYGGVTPLVVATDRGNKTITSMLISRGAMISAREEFFQ